MYTENAFSGIPFASCSFILSVIEPHCDHESEGEIEHVVIPGNDTKTFSCSLYEQDEGKGNE